MSDNKDKCYLIYNYFIIIYDLVLNEYYFESNEIQFLIEYFNELINKNNINKKNSTNNQINNIIKNENINDNINNSIYNNNIC